MYDLPQMPIPVDNKKMIIRPCASGVKQIVESRPAPPVYQPTPSKELLQAKRIFAQNTSLRPNIFGSPVTNATQRTAQSPVGGAPSGIQAPVPAAKHSSCNMLASCSKSPRPVLRLGPARSQPKPLMAGIKPILQRVQAPVSFGVARHSIPPHLGVQRDPRLHPAQPKPFPWSAIQRSASSSSAPAVAPTRLTATQNIALESTMLNALVREGFDLEQFDAAVHRDSLELKSSGLTPDYVLKMPEGVFPADLFTYSYSGLNSPQRIHDCYAGIKANISRKLTKYGAGFFCFASIPNADISLGVLKKYLQDELTGFSGHNPISVVYVKLGGAKSKCVWRSDGGLHIPNVSSDAHWQAITGATHADHSTGITDDSLDFKLFPDT